MTSVRVNRKAADRIGAGHPWIFSSDVLDRGGAEPGSAVLVVNERNRTLGTAHYSSTSQICLRLLSRRGEEISRGFFLARLRKAASHRQRIVADTEAYRVVHAEADLLPGLIVDRYGDFLVVQTLDQGMDRNKETIVDCLREIYAPRGVVLRNDAPVRAREDLPRVSEIASGEVPERVVVGINGFQFQVDLMKGQKTGVYLDQRENYAAAARYAGGRALDCFTSSGGFALHLAGKCESVEAVDSSREVLETAQANAAANQAGNITFREANVFDLLAGYAAAGRRFGTVVLDPPAFTKSRAALESASRGYREINLRALRLLESGGLLVTCSCSHHLSEAMLLEIVAQASLDAGRPLRVLERRTQARDHPILLTVPETHYLKCLILQVL